MITQQLVNGQITIRTIAKHSITNKSSLSVSKFEPCIDSLGQLIYVETGSPQNFNPSFDDYGQLICIS